MLEENSGLDSNFDLGPTRPYGYGSGQGPKK